MPLPLSDEDLARFGIRPEDEGAHPFDPRAEWWNESWFWDWFDHSATQAGHLRIGLHPNQSRAWVWFFLYRSGEWVGLEEKRLPVGDLRLDDLSYDRFGLRFSYSVIDPLRAGRVCFEGFGRVLAGPRAGRILPVSADLEITSVGPPHSHGRNVAPGHTAEGYASSRFEQPIEARGILSIDRVEREFRGRGERDHSWGPRDWNMEWTVLVLGGGGLRLQCTEVRIPGVPRIAIGYLHREKMVSLSEVVFDLDFRDDDVLRPVAGKFSVRAEDGGVVAGGLEVVSAVEIDLPHVLVPPRRTTYRRALVRAAFDEGGPPALGWIEFHRFREPA